MIHPDHSYQNEPESLKKIQLDYSTASDLYRASKENGKGDCEGNCVRLMEKLVSQGIQAKRLQAVSTWSISTYDKTLEIINATYNLKRESEKSVQYHYHVFVLVDGQQVYDLSAVEQLWGEE